MKCWNFPSAFAIQRGQPVEEMAIELRKEQRTDSIQSLEQHLREELETEVGEMQAGFLLDYFLKEIAPVVYNQGVVDAQRYFIEKTEDLTCTLFEEEFGYWFHQMKRL